MKTSKWILYFFAIAFLMALPLIWIVAGLAANLHQFHPITGWAVWVASSLALLVLCVPIIRFLRLPDLPPRELWDDHSPQVDGETWKQTALLLVRTSDDAEIAGDLRRVIHDTPNSLPDRVREELARRRVAASTLRFAAMRQAAVLSILSPHRQMDFLILLWINLRQVYYVARCYGFKPSPRGIFKLYAGIFGSALLIDSIDEVAEQAMAEGISKLVGSLPFVREATSLAYDGVRSAAYVGLIGLLTEYLLRNELQKPSSVKRKEMRHRAWRDVKQTVTQILSGKTTEPAS